MGLGLSCMAGSTDPGPPQLRGSPYDPPRRSAFDIYAGESEVIGVSKYDSLPYPSRLHCQGRGDRSRWGERRQPAPRGMGTDMAAAQ